MDNIFELGNGVRLFLGPFSDNQMSELEFIRACHEDEDCRFGIFHFTETMTVIRCDDDAPELPGEDFGWDTNAGTFESYLPGYSRPSGNEKVFGYARQKLFRLLHLLGAKDVPSTSDLERFEAVLTSTQDRREMRLRALGRLFGGTKED